MTRSANARTLERASRARGPGFGTTALVVGALALLAGCNDGDTGSNMEPGTGGTMALGGSGGTGTGGTAGMAGIGGTGGVGGSAVGGSGGVGGMLDAGMAGIGGTDAGVDAGPQGGSGGAETGIFAEPPFEPQGEPIDAPDNEWTWVPFPESRCRDDSPAGIDVNLNSDSSKVMIYLEGGGACFDSSTCGSNPASVGSQSGGSSGVFDRDNPDNPVADWNYVYVPYCTGDVHIGAQPDGTVEGVSGEQQFVGRLNLEKFLHRLVPTFADAEQVLLTGISAGGFGAASNSTFVQWAFDDIPVSVIDDSGPIFSEEYLPSCLNDRYRTTWNLDETVLADCGDACNADEDWSVQALEYGAKHTHPDAHFGIIEFDADGVIRGFYGVGTNLGADDCNGVLLFTPMAEDRFLNGLLDLRERIDPYEGFSTYYIPGTGHTIIGGGGFYSRSVGGVSLVDWFQGILDGAEDSHIGP